MISLLVLVLTRAEEYGYFISSAALGNIAVLPPLAIQRSFGPFCCVWLVRFKCDLIRIYLCLAAKPFLLRFGADFALISDAHLPSENTQRKKSQSQPIHP